MRHLIKYCVVVICLIIFNTPFPAYSNLTVIPPTTSDSSADTVSLNLSTDKNSYTTGEIMQFSISMAGDALIDIYMTATFSDGSFASYTSTMMPDSGNAIIPLIKGISLSSIAGTYTLPLPIVPAFPEGTSEIWVVFVKAGKNPMMSTNWLAEDMVSFTIEQSSDIDPLFDIENKTFTAPIGDIGTIQIAFGTANVDNGTISGSAQGSLIIAGPTGAVREKELTGTYSYSDQTLSIHLESDEGFIINITLTINEDGSLTGSYQTNDGKSGDIKFNLTAPIE
ncbi:MAG: hypothetical protein AB7U45_09230 [Desulfamplus sp.]